jgi:hypothetical protein
MSLIQRFKEFISPDGQRAVNDLAPILTTTMWTRHSFTPVTDFPMALRMWKSNPIAQACTITYSLMMPEAQIGVITPTGYDFQAPVIGMLTRNNWRIVFGEILTMMCVGGNAYGYKLRNASGAVIGMRWYSDQYFAPIDDGYGDVAAYHYWDGAKLYMIDKADVVHIRGFWYDPGKPLGGASPVALASESIEGFNEAASTVFNVHKNDAVPKTTILLNEEASPEQIDVMERTFKRRYGGNKRGSVGVLWGVQDIKRLALDYDEMGLSETFGQYETRICGTYKVHPIIAGTHMGLSQSTYSNFEQASKDFTNMVRVPFWNMIADQLNAQIAIPDYGVEVGFDLSTVQALAGQMVAVEAVSTQGTNDTPDTPDVPDTVDDMDDDNIETASLKGGAGSTPAPFRSKTAVIVGPETKAWLHDPDDQVYAKAYDEVLNQASAKIARDWGRALDKLYRSITNTKSLQLKIEDFSVDVWEQEFSDITEGSREELVSLLVTLAAEEVDAPEGEYAVARREGMTISSDKIAESVGTIRTDVQKLIADNPLAKEDDLAKLLKAKFTDLKASRADAIARTTSTATTGTVQKKVWADLGGIKREWVALAGARPAHAAAHGEREDAAGNFVVGGETTPYPSGPGLSAGNAVNCRCFTRARRVES